MAIFSWAKPKPVDITNRISADQPIYLISDLHLGDGTRSDIFLGKDRELLSFIDQVREEGAHLVIAGDVVDFHQAWAFERILGAHAEVLGALSRLAEDDGKVTYIWGNHDHDISLFRDFLHFDICSELLIGDAIRVSHGYDFDPHIGAHLTETHTATRAHHLAERMLDSWIRLPLENFYTFENRVVFWMFHKLALFIHTRDRALRAIGLTPGTGGRDFIQYWTMNQLGDPACIFENIRRTLDEGPYHTLVTGHSHLPGCVEVAPGQTYVNTGSWTFGSAQYARWDGQRFSVHDWISKKTYADQAYRPLLERRHHLMDFFAWWRENYMGWLRYRVAEEGRIPTVIRPPEQASSTR